MRKHLLLLIFFVTAILSDTAGTSFLEESLWEDNVVASESKWNTQKTIDLDIGSESVYSMKYHPDGKSILIGTTDFHLFRIRLSDGSRMWKTPSKMMFQKEFDGPTIFDISPDGKFFLSVGQTNPDIQSSERFLVIRNTEQGEIVKSIPVEQSLFYSITADIDYRYPGEEEAARRMESQLGLNWILTLDQAIFIEGGKKILASYKHNMDGPNFYDRRLIVYETSTGKKLNDFQVVCDPKTANWDQPAGFEIAAIQFPFVYREKGKAILFGTSHGRILEINDALMTKNRKTPLVENKSAGNIIYTPLSASEDVEVKDRQSIRSLAISPDGRLLYVTAGIDSGTLQFYVFDLDTKKEIFQSLKINAGKMMIPSNEFFIAQGMYGSSKFFIVNTKTHQLVFSSEEEGEKDRVLNFASHPFLREVALLKSPNQISLLRPSGPQVAW